MRKILVVDDEFTSRVILQKFLAAHGEVVVCAGGREAVEAFRAALNSGEAFSLVCMDVMMPGMSGIIALTMIRELEATRGIGGEARAKVLMTTGLDENDSDLEPIRHLFDSTMTKPFRLSTVVDTIVSLGLGK
jgi:two-component system, chemotaxis family, chemotaxis protein CheY